ncbi:unnamed protein product [Linum trigynum]|uniref:Uncharacterized protein n=1 Tax=Linum trigynum TaxID=586398 RepID=A0AAV2FPC8_9ROSI
MAWFQHKHQPQTSTPHPSRSEEKVNGDLQIDLMYHGNTDLLLDFNCILAQIVHGNLYREELISSSFEIDQKTTKGLTFSFFGGLLRSTWKWVFLNLVLGSGVKQEEMKTDRAASDLGIGSRLLCNDSVEM